MFNRAGASVLQVLVIIPYLYNTNVGKHTLYKLQVLVIHNQCMSRYTAYTCDACADLEGRGGVSRPPYPLDPMENSNFLNLQS